MRIRTWSGLIAGFVNLILIAMTIMTITGTGITTNLKLPRYLGDARGVLIMTSGIQTIAIASTLMPAVRNLHLLGSTAVMQGIVHTMRILMIVAGIMRRKLTRTTSIARKIELTAMLTIALASLLLTSSRRCSFRTLWSMR